MLSRAVLITRSLSLCEPITRTKSRQIVEAATQNPAVKKRRRAVQPAVEKFLRRECVIALESYFKIASRNALRSSSFSQEKPAFPSHDFFTITGHEERKSSAGLLKETKVMIA